MILCGPFASGQSFLQQRNNWKYVFLWDKVRWYQMIPGEDLVKSGSSNPIIIKLLKAAIHGLVSSDYNLFFMRKKCEKNVYVCAFGVGFCAR